MSHTEPLSEVDEVVHHGGKAPAWLIAIVLAGVFAAILGAGVGIARIPADNARRQSDQATANRNTCSSVANANRIDAVGILVLGASSTREQLEPLAVIGLPTDPTELQSEGQKRLVKAILDDARIDSKTNPLCPYFPGDPDRTPTSPTP